LARGELARRHGTEPQTLEITSWDLPTPIRAANRTYVMAVACPHADAETLLDLVESQRLSVVALDTHATAAARSCRNVLGDSEGTGAILDVGWASSRLVLVYHGLVVYDRDLPTCGVDSLVRAMVEQNGIDPSEAEKSLWGAGLCPAGAGDRPVGAAIASHLETFATELRIPVSYLGNQYPDALVRRLLLIGGGANIKGLREFLSEALALEARVVEVGDLAPPPLPAACEGGPSLALAIGLAQHSSR
jgi:Tfp pilus assembly PilM family ATPase